MQWREGAAELAAAAIVHEIGNSASKLLAEFARSLHRRGCRVRGLIQDMAPYGKDGRWRRALFDVDSGRVFRISQDLGSGSMSCSLDTGEMAEASSALRRGLAEDAELVVVNRFGEQEVAGRGFAAEMLELMAAGVPLLTVVSMKNLADWRRFTGDAATQLPPQRAAIEAWFAAVRERQSPPNRKEDHHA
jgi:nucleoside-triphosphatase THEP1